MCKLYVSDNLLNLKGSEWCKKQSYEELIGISDFYTLDLEAAFSKEKWYKIGYYKGIYLDRDDMDNLYLSMSERGEGFYDIEELEDEDESDFCM